MRCKTALSALLLMGAAVFASAPARAEVAIGFSFGYDGGYFSDPCDYYDYYSEAPPWGIPPDYCDYPVYFEPVYWGGYWYRGPIYYRWYGGERLYWLNGGWRHDEWRGSRPSIRWTDRGGWNRGRGGNHFYGNNNWSGRGDWNRGRGDWNRGRDRGDWNRGDRGNWSGSHNWSGGNGNWSGRNRSWSGGDHNRSGNSAGQNWSGGGNQNWSGGGRGDRNWSGGGGDRNWSGGGGGHNWSGGGGGHNWSGGGRGGDGGSRGGGGGDHRGGHH